MSIIDRFLTILTPYECLGCAAEGNLLCSDCIQQLTTLPAQCYRCLRPSPGGRTCVSCGSSALFRVRAAAPYEGLAKLLVTKLKFEGAQAAAREMAVLLKPLMPTDAVIVPVPTATGRVRGRGYDQAKLLARALSRETRLPCLDCLVRRGQTHQVGASRAERQRQLHGAFRPRKLDQIRGKHIVLVDDVVTTGATLETAARVLRQSGVARVEAAVFCAA